MANCGLLLNDGSSFILLNSGGVLLLNDNTCGTEAGVSESVIAATGTGAGSFVADQTAAAADSSPGGAGWAEQYKARQRQEQWEADNKRMELLERKKTRIQLDVGWLRSEVAAAKAQARVPRMLQRLQSKLDTAINDLMAVESELQALYIRMMQ